MLLLKAIFFIFILVVSHITSASEIIYEPLNPTFGGNPLNGSFLLGKAQSQNDHQEDSITTSALERFNETLERNILNGLAREFTNLAFGEEGFAGQDLIEGAQYRYGAFVLQVLSLSSDTMQIKITNTDTGDETTIEIPLF
ncbi:MAG: curli assembly protein CsgF [Pseudomonadota bacterium]